MARLQVEEAAAAVLRVEEEADPAAAAEAHLSRRLFEYGGLKHSIHQIRKEETYNDNRAGTVTEIRTTPGHFPRISSRWRLKHT